MAWLQRHRKPEVECEAVAGMWNETRAKRQYCLFLDLRIHQAGNNVCGHVSATGGPTNGYQWCMDAAIDGNYLTYFDWHCVAFTYDGNYVRAWLDGHSEIRVGFNPYAFPHGIYGAGPEGADFTVGAVHRAGELGNWFVGRLGGLAVYRRALAVNELSVLTALLPNMLTLLFSANYPGPDAAFCQYFGASLDHLVLALCFAAFAFGNADHKLSLRVFLRRRRGNATTHPNSRNSPPSSPVV